MVHPFFFSFPLSGISSLTSLQLPTGRFDISLISLGFSMPAYSLCGFTDDSLSRLAYRVIPVRLWDKINKTKEKKINLYQLSRMACFNSTQTFLHLDGTHEFFSVLYEDSFSDLLRFFCLRFYLPCLRTYGL